MADDAPNPREFIGANMPPDPIAEASPFDAHRVHITDLYTEVLNWADGEPIATEEQAAKVQELLRKLQEAGAAADDYRKVENKPFDDGKAEVQARYAPLISDVKTAPKGMVPKGVAALKELQRVWLVAEQIRIDKEAAAAKEIADKLAADAQAAIQAASASTDLAVLDAAEEKLVEAKQAATTATKAATTTARASGGYGRASSLRDYWEATMSDPVAAARWAWADHRQECEAFFLRLAQADVTAGKRKIVGFEIKNNPRVV